MFRKELCHEKSFCQVRVGLGPFQQESPVYRAVLRSFDNADVPAFLSLHQCTQFFKKRRSITQRLVDIEPSLQEMGERVYATIRCAKKVVAPLVPSSTRVFLKAVDPDAV